MRFALILMMTAVFPFLSIAQSNDETMDSLQYVQLTGIVINDSLERLPFTAVYDKTTQRGVICDYFGYFALVVHPGDTLQFSFIGFKKKTYIVPETDETNSLSIVSLLESDSIQSEPIDVYPWPSRDQFADAFVNLEIDNDAINQAKKRLSPQEMAFVYGTMGSDASISYKAQTAQYLNQVYYRGQQAPNNLLNPVAWSNFLKSLNNGDLKITR
jgi:hypothetical protein